MNKLAFTIPGSSTNKVSPISIQPPAAASAPDVNNLTNGALPNIITILFGIAILVAIFFLVFAGFQWMTSGGDKQKISDSKRRIVFTLVGLMVVFLAYVIIAFVVKFFGPTFNSTFVIP